MPAGKSQFDAWRERCDRIRGRMETFLSGPPPDDPLYLTNRTWQQKVRIAALVAAPLLLLIALVTIGASGMFRFHKVDTYALAAAETPAPAVPQTRLPDTVIASTDLDVINIRIARDARAPVVTGMVRNNTGRKVVSAEVSYYLADAAGNLVGTDTTTVQNVDPHGKVAFRMPLKIAKAEYVFARDVHPN